MSLSTSSLAKKSMLAAFMLMAFCLHIFPLGATIGLVIVLLCMPFVAGDSAPVNWLIVLPPIAWYAAHLIAMIYTANVPWGLLDLQIKLPFLLLPLVFIRVPVLDANEARLIALSFILGSVTAFVFSLGLSYADYHHEKIRMALHLYTENRGIDFFHGSYLSRFQHPSYAALFYTLALLFLFAQVQVVPSRFDWLRAIGIGVLCAAVILMGSKAGVIGLLVLLCVEFYVLVKYKKRRRFTLLLGFSFITLFLISFSLMENIRNRFFQMEKIFEISKIQKNDTESSAVRIQIWESAVLLIEKNPILGVGTGDVKDALFLEYASHGQLYAIDKKANAHSQFLQTWVATGLLGFLSLVAVFVCGFIHAFRARSRILALFLVLFLMNIPVESMFERQIGVMSFVLFYFVLASYNSSRLIKEQRH